jgi:hypothetical protein
MPLVLLGPPEQVQLRAGHCPRQLQPSGLQIFFLQLQVTGSQDIFSLETSTVKSNKYFLCTRKWFVNLLVDAFSKSKINIKFLLAPLKTLNIF